MIEAFDSFSYYEYIKSPRKHPTLQYLDSSKLPHHGGVVDVAVERKCTTVAGAWCSHIWTFKHMSPRTEIQIKQASQ